MIHKMKKLIFLITSKEYEAFIKNIREIGVVHIDNLQQGATSEELNENLALSSRLKNAIQTLKNADKAYEITANQTDEHDFTNMNGYQLLEHVESLESEENSLNYKLDSVNSNIEKLEPWGDFQWDKIELLNKEGYLVNFYSVSSKMFRKEWIDEYFATTISEINNKTYFVTFSKEQPDITAELISLPKQSLEVYKSEKESIVKKIDSVHNELKSIYENGIEVLQSALVDVENKISLSKVRLSHESIAEDSVRLLQGWVLEENEDKVVDYLEKEKIYYELSAPDFNDNVPVKISNNKFASLFEPILRMYSLPSYHDIDPLPLFAPFFMLFFGLCMGDAGYGALILIISIVLYITKPDYKQYGLLGIFLGGMTIICGTITGSFFGIDLSTANWDWIKPIQPYFLNDSKKDSFFGYSPMMVISVIIGLIQVLIGMTMAGCKAVKNYGFIYGIGKFSWVTALVCLTCLYGLPIFGVELPQVLQYVLYGIIAISVIGIFFLNSPGAYKKPIIGTVSNIGSGIWATYGMSTGLLGDLLSYIRLFALGLTGGVLGSVFNSLATDMTESMPAYIRWLPMILILLFGHGINFALCIISSFVHPMRLTFVEYFKNAEFEGGGKEYTPFKMKKYKK